MYWGITASFNTTTPLHNYCSVFTLEWVLKKQHTWLVQSCLTEMYYVQAIQGEALFNRKECVQYFALACTEKNKACNVVINLVIEEKEFHKHSHKTQWKESQGWAGSADCLLLCERGDLEANISLVTSAAARHTVQPLMCFQSELLGELFTSHVADRPRRDDAHSPHRPPRPIRFYLFVFIHIWPSHWPEPAAGCWPRSRPPRPGGARLWIPSCPGAAGGDKGTRQVYSWLAAWNGGGCEFHP